MKKDLSIFKRTCKYYVNDSQSKLMFSVNIFGEEYTVYANSAVVFLSKQPIKEIEEGIADFNLQYNQFKGKFEETNANKNKNFIEQIMNTFSFDNHDNWHKFTSNQIDNYLSYLDEEYKENKKTYGTKAHLYSNNPYCIEGEKNIWVNPMFAKCAFDFVGNTEEVYLFGTLKPILFINSEMNRMALVLPVVRNRNV